MGAARQRRGRSRRAQQPASLTPPQLVGARSTVSFFTIDLERLSDWACCMSWFQRRPRSPCWWTGPKANAENQLRELSEAARTLGPQLHALNASSERDSRWPSPPLLRCVRERHWWRPIRSVFIRREKLVSLAMAQGVPAIYDLREFAED